MCPICNHQAQLLKPVAPLRDLYRLIQQFLADSNSRPRRRLSLKRSMRLNSESKLPSFTDSTDLMGLFCKYAKDDAAEHGERSERIEAPVKLESTLPPKEGRLIPTTGAVSSVFSISPRDKYTTPIEKYASQLTNQSLAEDVLAAEQQAAQLFLGFNEKEEYNFSRCFPFHRKVSTFQTQQNKILFKSKMLVKKLSRFIGSAISTQYDRTTNTERTLFVLVSERRWELYEYTTNGRPALVACGKLTGEFGSLYHDMKLPVDEGIVVRNEFSGNDKAGEEEDGVHHRLKSWVHLYCSLSERFLVISGTRGVVRVLNVDPSLGPRGAPVYTYLTNFPIRCVSMAPSNGLIACGITALERISGKQQPFIIVHKIDSDSFGKVTEVTPITITVPYRDPLKIISFNASSTHLVCCTVYEMRYFVIKLRSDETQDYKKPRLIWSDMRVNRKNRKKLIDGDSESDRMDEALMHDDDQMLDNEGITDIKFGLPYTNTMVMTSSSLKSRPSIVLKLNGPTIDSRRKSAWASSGDFFYENELHISATPGHDDDADSSNIADVDVLMKIPEIGSNIYRAEVSPRGDGMIFVDKLGRLLLVATPNVQLNLVGLGQALKRVVQLGESADALRFCEATSVKFSSDGGKIFAVDRKGLFQVFDFTKGIPGEDPEVIKCKIISV